MDVANVHAGFRRKAFRVDPAGEHCPAETIAECGWWAFDFHALDLGINVSICRRLQSLAVSCSGKPWKERLFSWERNVKTELPHGNIGRVRGREVAARHLAVLIDVLLDAGLNHERRVQARTPVFHSPAQTSRPQWSPVRLLGGPRCQETSRARRASRVARAETFRSLRGRRGYRRGRKVFNRVGYRPGRARRILPRRLRCDSVLRGCRPVGRKPRGQALPAVPSLRMVRAVVVPPHAPLVRRFAQPM